MAFTPGNTSGIPINNQQYQQTLNPGDQNPYATNNAYPIASPPGSPGQSLTDRFLPSLFGDPFKQGMQAATTASNFSSQAIPGAADFQQGLYAPGLNPMEQSGLQASANLAGIQLGNTQAKLGGMFENSASSSGLAPAYLQAANQTADQLGQQASQMVQQRQGLAAQTLPFTMGFPIQAAQASQQSAEGLFGMGQQAMYGDSQFPLGVFGSNPFASPTVLSQAGSSGKGKS